MGAGKKLKARSAGDQKGKPPLRIPKRQSQQATKKASPPCAPPTLPRPRAVRRQAPAGRVVCSPAPVPPPAQPRGCKGRSPLHEITLILPLPRRGRGSGGWGQEIKLKARSAGDQKGNPPCGFRNGKVSRRPKRQAPLPPCPPKKPPPWLTCTETQPRIVHPVQPAERNAKKIRKLFGKPVDKPRKECYNGNATGAWQRATCREGGGCPP